MASVRENVQFRMNACPSHGQPHLHAAIGGYAIISSVYENSRWCFFVYGHLGHKLGLGFLVHEVSGIDEHAKVRPATGFVGIIDMLVSAILGLWVVRCLRSTFWEEKRDIGKTVGGLLAGIALVDLLAVPHVSPELAGIFLGLFALSLAAQRWVPAT